MERICRVHGNVPEHVVVDCVDVTFCDSTLVTVLLEAQSVLRGRDSCLSVRNPPAMLRRISALLGEGERLGIPTARAAGIDES
jgi:anti-anti-sigma regulatory factor